ncbi:MAG TPA: hypothetical protein VGN56_01725 [Candidatus Paceibacterota bacterium]|jgi:hypothetical protein|nr:hypothetical protein [Candidatus Paceibacterota bacterium]
MDAVTNVGLQITDFATKSAGNAQIWAGNFLALLILFGLMIAFSYKAGRGGIISLLLAFYAGYAIYILFPYTNAVVGAGGTPIIKAVISVVIYGIATYVPFHFIQRLTKGGFGVLSFFPRLVLSILAATFLLAVGYHVFHVSNVYTFPEPMNTLFGPDKYFFWWFIAPMLGLIFLVH